MQGGIQRGGFLGLWLAGVFCLQSTAQEPGPSFSLEILPRLTQAGCNTGECHGAATGQGGLKLSLLGYDARSDYLALTRDRAGRRMDLPSPEKSLLLRKPTRQTRHKGGRLFTPESETYQRLLLWIRQGAPEGNIGLNILTLKAEPQDWVGREPGDSTSLQVTALLEDGSQRDVSHLALYQPEDPHLARLTEVGQLTLNASGVTTVMIRFGGQVTSIRAGIPFEGPTLPPEIHPHPIDQAVDAELRKWNLPTAPMVDAGTFLRRAYLDLTGQLPSPEQIRKHLKKTDSVETRQAIIEELLRSEAFTDFWTFKLAEILRIHPKHQGEEGMETYHTWLRDGVARDLPWNEMASSLLTSLGDGNTSGPPNFYRMTSDPRDMAEFTAQTLLGLRIACARCHNHPFDRWTRSDYHEFAAHFAGVFKRGSSIVLQDRGPLKNPVTRRPAEPRVLCGDQPWSPSRLDPRIPLAQWMTSRENPYFAKVFVNRVWKELLGRGLVEPVDDLRVTLPPSIPGLLESLSQDFAEHRFSLRHLVRTITSSQTYQRSSTPHPGDSSDGRFFSHTHPRPIRGQVLTDLVDQVTETTSHFPDQSPGTRAIQIPNPSLENYTLDVLGRCSRLEECGPDASGGGLAMALHFIHGNGINEKIRDGWVRSWMKRLPDQKPGEVIQAAYLRTLGRPAREEEWKPLALDFQRAAHRLSFLEDLQWALISSSDFRTIR